ncbi:hypothetical protein ABER75_00700 [Niallia taxi]|uniref:hypothetical protein n=1 Tax=Bacillati TaxID=1783272 RepID=UPI0015F5895D|nr:hypothetical protein [Niallia taxi]MDK8640168.1 hypothetical protein [Niallia taxi]MED4039061.1 hypothetical protein [Niallia taxi]MED4054141.1 hypothetical protein [Niallia taxi]
MTYTVKKAKDEGDLMKKLFAAILLFGLLISPLGNVSQSLDNPIVKAAGLPFEH